MPIPISAGVRQLLAAPNYVHLLTLRADGSPHTADVRSQRTPPAASALSCAAARRNRNLTSIAVAALCMFTETLNRTLAGRHRQPVPS
jgi:precorrin-6B methylase 1